MDIFRGSSQNRTLFSGHSMHFFLKVKVKNGGYFVGLLKFQILFLGVLETPDIFWVNGRCWAQAYV